MVKFKADPSRIPKNLTICRPSSTGTYDRQCTMELSCAVHRCSSSYGKCTEEEEAREREEPVSSSAELQQWDEKIGMSTSANPPSPFRVLTGFTKNMVVYL